MNKKLIGIISSGLVLILLIVFVVYKKSGTPGTETNTYVEETKRRSGPCPGVSTLVESENKKYKMIPNWYECNPLKAGDWVWYRYSFTKDPVPRRVVAVPGDQFSVKKDSQHKNWNLSVNDELALTSEKKVIAFGSILHEPPLSLYQIKGVGKLKLREAIVFSDPGPGNLDSGMFGVVNVDDFLGKLETPEERGH